MKVSRIFILFYVPEKILAKCSYPNKSPESKISNPPKPFDHMLRRHLKSGVPPSPRGASYVSVELR